jgi:hypothetical protein
MVDQLLAGLQVGTDVRDRDVSLKVRESLGRRAEEPSCEGALVSVPEELLGWIGRRRTIVTFLQLILCAGRHIINLTGTGGYGLA